MRASELFMRDYYLRARRMHALATAHLERLAHRHEKRRWFQRRSLEPATGGFVMRDGLLGLGRAGRVRLDAERGRMLGVRVRAGDGFGAERRAAVGDQESGWRRRGRDADGGVRGAGQTLLRMMSRTGKVARGLRLMHNLDFLGSGGAGVRPGDLSGAARPLPPLHGRRAHVAGARGARRARRVTREGR
jgi:UTP:GlnB (protein PII) uridylyltransferase